MRALRGRTTSISGCAPRRRRSKRTRSRFADIAYPPFLGEAFGGSTGLVDIGVGRDPLEQALGYYRYGRDTGSDLAAATSHTAGHEGYAERDSVPEVENLLDLDAGLLILRRTSK